MGKLSGYCINQILYKEDLDWTINHFYGVTRSGWFKTPFNVWDKLRMHFMYSFEDRYDQGYNLDSIIEYLELIKGHKVILKLLKDLKEAKFEEYSVSTVSSSFLIYMFSIEHKYESFKASDDLGMFTTRYGVKKFRKFIKNYEFWKKEQN